MKFSVIIPTFNEQEYIESCLRALLAQTYDQNDFEVIVSDQSSPDETAKRVRKFPVKLVSSVERGIGLGRNVGARHASGDIFVFVDADTVLYADFLSQLSQTFSDDGVVGVTGRAIAQDGKGSHRFIYWATYALVNLCNFFGLALFPGMCVAYRKKEFNLLGGFREDFGVAEDLDLSKRISKLGSCRINNNARAYVSTRRLQQHAFSTVLFHIYHDLQYLLFGTSARVYPKSEELRSPSDLWKMNR